MCPVAQACLTPRDAMDCSLPGSSVCGILAGRNTGVGSHFLLQGTFLTQGSNWHLLYLLHWQTDSLPLVPAGKPLFVFIFVVLKPHQLLKTQIGSNWGTSLSHFFSLLLNLQLVCLCPWKVQMAPERCKWPRWMKGSLKIFQNPTETFFWEKICREKLLWLWYEILFWQIL